MVLALGLSQLITLVALYLRMKNIVGFLNYSVDEVAQRPDARMARSEKIIKRLYYISTSCFVVFTTGITVATETNKERLEDIANYLLIVEYLVCVVLLAVYLYLLIKKVDQINHLNFITEKKALYYSSITFIVVMALRCLVKTVLVIKPSLIYDHGFFTTVIVELLANLLFELIPLTIIMVQHLRNRINNQRQTAAEA